MISHRSASEAIATQQLSRRLTDGTCILYTRRADLLVCALLYTAGESSPLSAHTGITAEGTRG